jgi:pyruvate-formate lyase
MTPTTRTDVEAVAAWRSFAGQRWRERIDVADFIPAATAYEAERTGGLAAVFDACATPGGFRLNVDVLDRGTRDDAVRHPEA